MSEEERVAAIAADVEAWWHLRAGEAAQILLDTLPQARDTKAA